MVGRVVYRPTVGLGSVRRSRVVESARDGTIPPSPPSEGGTVTISTRLVSVDEETAARYPDARSGSYARVSVADAGTGIPPDHLVQIFEPLFTTKREGKGTGLGLATCSAS